MMCRRVAAIFLLLGGASASGSEFWPFDDKTETPEQNKKEAVPAPTLPGYIKHRDHACGFEHNLFTSADGAKMTLEQCALKCETFFGECTGFHFANEKHREFGKCQVSKECNAREAKKAVHTDFYAREPAKSKDLGTNPFAKKKHKGDKAAEKAGSMIEEQKPQPRFDDETMTFIRKPDKEQAKKLAKQAEPKKAEEKTGTTLAPASATTSTSSVGVTLENLEGAPGTTPGSAAVKGDPHLQNVKGQAFDVMQTGNMLLLEIPRGSSPETVNLNMRVDIDYLGAVQCGPTFITSAYLTGRWLGRSLDFRSGPIAKKNGKTPKKTFGIRLDQKEWIPHAEFDKSMKLSKDATIATVERKFLIKVGSIGIAVSQPKRPRVFLDVQVKGLQNLDVEIGGLLGVDDHSAVEQEPSECKVTATRV